MLFTSIKYLILLVIRHGNEFGNPCQYTAPIVIRMAIMGDMAGIAIDLIYSGGAKDRGEHCKMPELLRNP
jgi:hypothetical protein